MAKNWDLEVQMKDWGQIIADKKLRSSNLDKKLRFGNCSHIGMKLNSK